VRASFCLWSRSRIPATTQTTALKNTSNHTHQKKVWDLGGQANLRPAWATYYRGADAALVVVDSTDRARIGIIKSELAALLAHEHLAGAAVLVFANKQDLAGAMGPAELTAALGLDGVRRQAWHVQGSCALTGEGLVEGLEWVAQRVAHLPPAPVPAGAGTGGAVNGGGGGATAAAAPAAAAAATGGAPAGGGVGGGTAPTTAAPPAAAAAPAPPPPPPAAAAAPPPPPAAAPPAV
jgi:signal recognition particle receptor subunit beta